MNVLYLLRALGFLLLQILMSNLVFIIQLLTYPIVYFVDPNFWFYQRLVSLMATISLWPFISVRIEGKENLPPQGEPCIFVTNHSSFMDPSLCAWVLMSHNFKCTFKHDLLYVPGVGACLWMAGHLPVNRKIKEEKDGWFSGKWVMAMQKEWLARGACILNYPEGTRKSSGEGGRLGDFKPGAFSLSERAKVPLVPITLSGARALLPPGLVLKFGEVVITVHKPLPPPSEAGEKVTEQMAAAKAAIDSALRSPLDDIPVKKEASKVK